MYIYKYIYIYIYKYIYIYIYTHRPFSYLVIKENRQFLQHDKTVNVIPPQWNSPIDETLK